MAHALITGASGFIGWHLARNLLARGDRVRGLVRSTSQVQQLAGLDLEMFQADVTHPESLASAMRGVDVVYHLAGLVKAFSLAEFLRVNEAGTRNVAQACANQPNPPVMVLVSSLAAAGPSPADRPRNENDPAAPVSNYGLSKRAGELAAEAFSNRIPLCVLRPPIVFGEYDVSMSYLFRPIWRRRIHAVPGFRPRECSLIHAADLSEAMARIADRGQRVPPCKQGGAASQGYYYAADPARPTLTELGELIGRALGLARVHILRAPEFVGWCVGACSELVGRMRGRPSMLNRDKIREATAGSWTCSARRAREELGFEVARPLEERLRQTADWYRDQNWL